MRTVITSLLFLTICLSSCDPAISVVIANKTNGDKKIKVLYPSGFTFPGDIPYALGIRDSIITYDLFDKDSYLHPLAIPKISWDTTARTYSFFLKENRSAIVESRFLAPFPTYGQVFIINDTDTIKLLTHGKDFKKRPKLAFGGIWIHSITEKK